MKRILVLALLVLCAGIASAAPKIIVIDPGHGGDDPGGTGNSLQEKSVVLDVSKRFEALLDADTADTAGGGEWTTFLTRNDDTFVSLAGRSAYSNNKGADRFMCIHSNAFSNTTANGTETFSYSEGTTGAALRNLVQEEMIAAWKLTNRGNKTANFAVLRETAAPAELHELAFITNVTDAAKLGSPEERQKAAIAHLRAIQRHYNHEPYIPNSGNPVENGELAGHVFDDLGPIANATVTAGDKSATTGADGAYSITGLPAGAITVTAAAEGHTARSVEAAIAGGARAEVDIELMRDGGPPVDKPGDNVGGGCSTTGASALWLVGLALVGLLLVARRR